MSELTRNKHSAVVTLAAIIVLVYGLQFARELLVPFLIAAFLAMITIRPMLWLQQKRVPTILAALLIVLVIMLILTVFGTILGRTLAEFTAAVPGYQQRLDIIVANAIDFVARYLEVDEQVEDLGDLINPGWAVNQAAKLLNALRDVLTRTFLIFITVIFILLEAGSLATKVEVAFGERRETLDRASVFLTDLGRYLGIKTLVSMLTGILAYLLTWSLGLDFPQLWGMLAFLLNYIPTIGSIIAAIPAIFVALVQLGFGEATAVMIGFIAINVSFGNIIEPRLMGHGVGISPLVVFVGLFVWGWVFGPVGMLLSVPLTMTLKLALENDERTRWVAILIGSERDAQHELNARRRAAAAKDAKKPAA